MIDIQFIVTDGYVESFEVVRKSRFKSELSHEG